MFAESLGSKKIYLLLVLLLALGSQAVKAQQQCTSFEITNPLEMSPRQYTIGGVEVQGITTVQPDFVIGQAGLEIGSTITHPGSDLSDAIRQLNRTGLFTDICIERIRTEGSEIYLRIVLREQPRLESFQIEGVKRSQREDLRERISLLEGFAVTEGAQAQAVNTIQRYYKEKGYWFTGVEISSSTIDSVRNRVELTFHVDAGERLEIKEITFTGNEHYSEKTLRKELDAIEEDRWWKFFSKKLFKEEDFEEAKQNLQAFYSRNGFLDFRVTGDSVYTYTYKDDKQGVGVRIDLAEGPQYKLRNLTFEGNTAYPDEALSQIMAFEEGDIFNYEKFQENLQGGTPDGSDIFSLYHNSGYLFSQFQPDIRLVAEDTVDVTVEITEDEQAEINQISFSGNTKTHDDVIRRSLYTIPGQIYNRSRIIRTVRELSQVGYFRPESINPVFDTNQEENLVNITYQLDESQSTDNFELSGGFGGRGIGLILSARFNFNNFSLQRAFSGEGWDPVPSGDGQQFSLGAQITGSGYKSFNLGFQEPWLAGRPLSLGVNASYDLIRYRNSDIRNELFSSSVSLGRRLQWPDSFFRHQSALTYQLYDVTGGTQFLAEGTSSLLTLRQSIERNSIDNPISPTTGSKLQLSGEIAPPLPGFSQFYKLKSLYQDHTTIVGNLVLTNSVEYGYLGYIGDVRRSNFQRFILGGTPLQQRQSFLQDNIDLRGFPGGRSGSISPREDGELIGGRLYSKYSMELRIKAVNEQQLQVIPYTFMDAGNAYRNFEDFSPFDVKRSAGVGVRLYLPILGLVDLSYGYRLDGIPGTSVQAGEWQFLFNIGSPFQ